MILNAYTFITAIAAILPVVSLDSSRPSLCGIHISEDNGKLRIQGSNGAAAARCWIDAPQVTKGYDAIWSRKVCLAISRMKVLKRVKDSATVDITPDSSNFTIFTYEETSLNVPHEQCMVPDYCRVFKTAQSPALKEATKLKRRLDASIAISLLSGAKRLACPRYGTIIDTSSVAAYECLNVEVPTCHGNLPEMSEDAQFILMPQRQTK